MRTLIVSVLTSLDGYFEGSGKDLSTMPFEDAFETHNHELLSPAGIGLVPPLSWLNQKLARLSGRASSQSCRMMAPLQADVDDSVGVISQDIGDSSASGHR